MITLIPKKSKLSKRSKAFTILTSFLLLSLLSCVVIESVSASHTFSYSLNNWDLNSTWHGKVVNGTGVFTFQVSYGGVHLTNDTFDGKFCFSMINGVNTGYSIEVYAGAGSRLNALSKDNTVYLKSLASGAETLLYTGSVSSSSFKLVVDNSSLVQFYINGAKVYQNTAISYTCTELQYFTTEVPLPVGVITQPSCFTGSFSVSILSDVGGSGASSSGSIDSSGIAGIGDLIIPLMIAILPVTIYMAVFKMIPKMLKGMKL